jgi:uncharacterized protein YndB with AHSA1/START domain
MTTVAAIEVEHRIAAPPDIVFSFFVDPDRYRLWQGLDAELDPRPGGRFCVRITSTGRVRGEYVLVDPSKQVVFTWGWESDAELPPALRDFTPGISTVEVTLIPDGDGTIVRLRHAGIPTEEARGLHDVGWPIYLQRLGVATTGGDPGPDTLASQLSSRSEPA